MTAYPKVVAVVKTVLKRHSRAGSTTRGNAAMEAWNKIEHMGGPTKFGIGAAAMRIGCMHVISGEVLRQLKHTLTDHEVEYILPTKLPEEFKEVMGKFPRWIAIEECTDAIWMYWRNATQSHWWANAELKRKKAEQTLMAARTPRDIAELMERLGIKTLGDVFQEK